MRSQVSGDVLLGGVTFRIPKQAGAVSASVGAKVRQKADNDSDNRPVRAVIEQRPTWIALVRPRAGSEPLEI
jgi:hypothetical protein